MAAVASTSSGEVAAAAVDDLVRTRCREGKALIADLRLNIQNIERDLRAALGDEAPALSAVDVVEPLPEHRAAIEAYFRNLSELE